MTLREKMRENIEFVLADLSDVDDVTKIYMDIHEEHANGINYPKWPYNIYPIEEDAKEGIDKQELYVLKIENQIVGSVILNHHQEEGYEQAQWLVEANENEVMVIHTLAISPNLKGRGYAGIMIKKMKELAIKQGCTAIRLDITNGNLPARYLYQKHGFYFTGIADLNRQSAGIDYCEMYECNLERPRDPLSIIEKTVNDFVTERDWHQYHTADNLSKSIIIEAAELLECFQWDNDYDFHHVCEELADVMIYSIQLALYLNVDIKDIIVDKMQKNKIKYPL